MFMMVVDQRVQHRVYGPDKPEEKRKTKYKQPHRRKVTNHAHQVAVPDCSMAFAVLHLLIQKRKLMTDFCS